MLAVKDFVELMTDQHLAEQWSRGLWKLGQVLYVKVGRRGSVSFCNAPIILTPKEQERLGN